MAERLRFGMIGCGEIAVQTSGCVLQSEHARVVHCMDPVKSVAEDLAAKHDAKASDKTEELLADDDVQAVVISTPHYLHSPLSVQAAEAGKHALTEKPIACTLAQADAMIEAASKAGVRLGVLFPARFGFGAQKARELVRAGALGKIVAVKFHAMGDKPGHYWDGGYTGRVKDDWRVTLQKSGGGFLIMNMIHNLDAMIHILDLRPRRIYAEYGTFRTPVEVEDFISFVMRFTSAGEAREDDGGIASLDGSSAAAGDESFGDRIYGERGQIAMAGGKLRVFLKEARGDLKADEWVTLSPPEGFPNPRTAAVDAFARSCISGLSGGFLCEVPVPGEEGRRSLEIVRGAYLSMKRGGPVEFPVRE